MWVDYKVTMQFQGWLLGGIPKHPDVIKSWLEARMPSDAAYKRIESPTPIYELAEEVGQQVGAMAIAEQKVWCGFKSDEKGLYIDGYHPKSHLKECANILQMTLGIKALKAKLADRVYVVEDRIYLGQKEPDGDWEHAVHILTMQGPRSALKRSDYVDKPVIAFTLRVLDDGIITEKILKIILDYGSLHGFGAERGLGHGRYDFTLTRITKMVVKEIEREKPQLAPTRRKARPILEGEAELLPEPQTVSTRGKPRLRKG